MNKITIVLLCVFIAGCNSMYIKPGQINKNSPFYVKPAGFSMQRSIKERLEQRGYDVYVGKQVTSRRLGTTDGGEVDISEYKIENVRYVINVQERNDRFSPIWCIFNGFWFWNFSVSIADQQNGKEIFAWRGRGCQNSSLRKLDDALDKLEDKSFDEERDKNWRNRVNDGKLL